MNKFFPSIIAFVLLTLVLSGCNLTSKSIFSSPTITPVPTLTFIPPTQTVAPSPSPTQFPTKTPAPTETAFPATATFTSTPTPQQLLLRRKCGRDYLVRANEPIQIFYGGWGVTGNELAVQWSTSLIVELEIDGQVIPGELQQPTHDLPYNCTSHPEDTYWLYYMVILPGLSEGEHYVTVTISSLRALPDGSGMTYGPGQLLTQNFTITTR